MLRQEGKRGIGKGSGSAVGELQLGGSYRWSRPSPEPRHGLQARGLPRSRRLADKDPRPHLVHGDAARVAGQQLVKVVVLVLVAHAAGLAGVAHVHGLEGAWTLGGGGGGAGAWVGCSWPRTACSLLCIGVYGGLRQGSNPASRPSPAAHSIHSAPPALTALHVQPGLVRGRQRGGHMHLAHARLAARATPCRHAALGRPACTHRQQQQ